MSADVTSGKLGGMKSAVHFTFSRGETMIRKTLVNVGVAALLGGMAVAAQAATVKFNGWKHGDGNDVIVDAPAYGTPNAPGAGGSFVGTVSNAPTNLFGTPANTFNSTFEMYCVELTENIGLNGEYNNYNIVESVSYFTPTTALTLARLLTAGLPAVNTYQGSEGKDFASTALQLAIWNVIYDKTPGDLSLTSGTFMNAQTANTSGLNALADQYLGLIANTTNNLQLFVLRSDANNPNPSIGRQDQLIYLQGGVPGGGNIPEPTSLALAFGALGALGIATRRRQATKG
jgi:hypothetical protein